MSTQGQTFTAWGSEPGTHIQQTGAWLPESPPHHHFGLAGGAAMGANAMIVRGTTISCYAFVGAGAMVAKDVADYPLLVGKFIRPIGWMCDCGVKLNPHLEYEAGGKRFEPHVAALCPLF